MRSLSLPGVSSRAAAATVERISRGALASALSGIGSRNHCFRTNTSE